MVTPPASVTHRSVAIVPTAPFTLTHMHISPISHQLVLIQASSHSLSCILTDFLTDSYQLLLIFPPGSSSTFTHVPSTAPSLLPPHTRTDTVSLTVSLARTSHVAYTQLQSPPVHTHFDSHLLSDPRSNSFTLTHQNAHAAESLPPSPAHTNSLLLRFIPLRHTSTRTPSSQLSYPSSVPLRHIQPSQFTPSFTHTQANSNPIAGICFCSCSPPVKPSLSVNSIISPSPCHAHAKTLQASVSLMQPGPMSLCA